jgi:hypothetical protein
MSRLGVPIPTALAEKAMVRRLYTPWSRVLFPFSPCLQSRMPRRLQLAAALLASSVH